MKSPIIYYGGKTSMLPVILPMIPEHKVYTEVFFGGGSVFWAKKKVKNETINDKLGFVVNFYRVLKDNYEELNKLIQRTLFSRDDHDKSLLIMRNLGNYISIEQAWAFWMCSNFSYGNKIGGGLKYSNEQSVLPPNIMKRNKEAFTRSLVDRIELVIIENRDALHVLNSRNVKKAFHYIDPPYPGADQGHYKGYKMEEFEKLLQWLPTCKGSFLLSNYMSDTLMDNIKQNNWEYSSHTFNNKGMRKHDRSKHEILVWNYELPQQKLAL